MTSIFIVEDELALQTLYEMMFKGWGYEIFGKANNGEEAVQMYKEFNDKPDIILMDHRMPIKNGLDAMSEILQINNHVKVIFASADISIKQKALKLGACAFLDKPFNMRKLLSIIQKVNEEIVVES